jgi:hypothetical protein
VPALLLFSSRTFVDVIFRDELLARAAQNDRFQLALALTRDQPQRVGDFGRRVDAAMVADGRRVSGKAARATPGMSSSVEEIHSSRPRRKARSRLASVP